MDDKTIKELLFSRSERGLEELDKAYGKLCRRIALNILGDPNDAEECINDAYFAVWNRIPPADPESLPAYLSRIVRNICIDRLRRNTAEKRNTAYSFAMEELMEDIPAFSDVEEEVLQHELIKEIASFVRALPEENQFLFVQRYWLTESVPDIARAIGRSSHYVSVKLFRIRKKLAEYLAEKGVCIHET
ncbi:MAG: sigma-70 family RNA polymerase sigma factor [Lachnospiraceae bacterium]|nr:sigma-70 family RNA polymerase sigma factor [Lachnospiraceae bacterium]